MSIYQDSWTYPDFALHGDFCPLDMVHTQIEKIRGCLHAKSIVHLALSFHPGLGPVQRV